MKATLSSRSPLPMWVASDAEEDVGVNKCGLPPAARAADRR